MTSSYDDPAKLLEAIDKQEISLSEVSMEQWIQGVLMSLTLDYAPQLDVMIVYKGNYLEFHHHVASIAVPADPASITRTMQ